MSPAKKKSTSTTNDAELPWYEAGLRFRCSGCGNCCTGAPGYVWVNQAEVAAIAGQLGLPLEQFEARHVRPVGIRRSLVEYANGDCVFFDSKSRKCDIYEHRPRQCRTWPFWKSNLATPQAWGETCEGCPGSGKGKLYQLDAIEPRVAVIRV